MKKAPAPSAITVRSRKIQSPNANRLSMLVWFRPLTRHRPAAVQAEEQQRGPGQRSTAGTGPSSSASGRRAMRYLIHLRVAPRLSSSGNKSSDPCRAAPAGGSCPRRRAPRRIQVHEPDGARRARLDAGRHVVGGIDILLTRRGGLAPWRHAAGRGRNCISRPLRACRGATSGFSVFSMPGGPLRDPTS